MTLGTPPQYVLPALLVAIVPLQYAAFCVVRRRGEVRSTAAASVKDTFEALSAEAMQNVALSVSLRPAYELSADLARVQAEFLQSAALGETFRRAFEPPAELARSLKLEAEVLRSAALSESLKRTFEPPAELARSLAVEAELFRGLKLEAEVLRSAAVSESLRRAFELPAELARSLKMELELLRRAALSESWMRAFEPPPELARSLKVEADFLRGAALGEFARRALEPLAPYRVVWARTYEEATANLAQDVAHSTIGLSSLAAVVLQDVRPKISIPPTAAEQAPLVQARPFSSPWAGPVRQRTVARKRHTRRMMALHVRTLRIQAGAAA